MRETYVVRANKIVTAGPLGTIEQGALVVEDGILLRVIPEGELSSEERSLPFADFGKLTLTPALADCHCHLLEYAAGSLYPVAEPAHLLAGKALLLNALCSGVTALGEQICGHPACGLSVEEYRQAVEGLPLTVRFALCGITLGTEGAPHYSALTGSAPVEKYDLLSPQLLGDLVEGNDYPGENVFLNATPANLPLTLTPQAGELVFQREELLQIVKEYHRRGKRVGVHVGGRQGIQMALDCKVGVLHHAHGITPAQMRQAALQGAMVVATPLGGTHLSPNPPEEIAALLEAGVEIAIATDAYLPPSEGLGLSPKKLYGTESLMLLAQPAMVLLREKGWSENDCLRLLTAAPAKVMGCENRFGQLLPGMEATFLAARGIPGLEVTKPEDIRAVYHRGKAVIQRL